MSERPWTETRGGAVVAAAGLVALGVLIAAGGFALSSAIGGATAVVAIGPFILAFRLLARAFRGQIKMLALSMGALTLFIVVATSALSALHFDAWDLDGEEAVRRAGPLPAEAIGTFLLPSGDPGIPGIYRAFVDESGLFDRVDGDDHLSLFLVDGGNGSEGLVVTDVARVDFQFRMPWNEVTYRRLIGRCAGTATFDDGAWHLAFTDAECRTANGRYPADPARR